MNLKSTYLFANLIILMSLTGCAQENKTNSMKFKELTTEEERVIIHKGTEPPFSGKYEKNDQKGSYICKRCGTPLYRSDDKFDAGCGWPSFDEEIPGAVKQIPDSDGQRTEIICAKCGGHLGHVFAGEQFTPKNVRHCVNSISLDFIPADQNAGKANEKTTSTAIFAGGCFWGVEYYLQKSPGVKTVKSGYIGGHKDKPTYEEVCSGKSGHLEAVEVIFDPSVTTYETLARLFFEIHDPTQWNHQGPDHGEQYQSAIFYLDEEQKQTAEKLIDLLKKKGYNVVTKVRKADQFWIAENYHQDYYDHKGSTPYCHGYVRRF